MQTITGIPLDAIPAWAVLQRRLFHDIEEAWRLFESRYTGPDGGILFPAEFTDRSVNSAGKRMPPSGPV